jgi:ribose 5-phosphate isomerase
VYMGNPVPYHELAEHIQGVQGVLAHGLLLDVITEAVVATEKGPQTLRKADVSA